MMLGPYGLGILAAILSGGLHAFGAILQKSAVNRIPAAERDDRFMRRLLRTPAWLLGLALSFGVGTVFNLLAQRLIGPALVPGLTASGMLVLAVASVRLIGEHLRPLEMLGILLLVAGTGLLGWSRLAIPADQVDLLDHALLLRILGFTVVLGACWLLSFWLDRAASPPHGQIEPMGVHPAWRRLGLGGALLAEVLRRLYAHGAVEVYVETDNYRDATFALYESAGFLVEREVLVYRKDYQGLSAD
jgi:ribosomal protein S18 acetylase RimI-like enzyme